MRNKSILILLFLFTASFMFAQLDRTKKPLPGPAPVINLGDYELFELPNGLKVIVVENHKLPKVNFRFIVNREPLLEKELAGYINTTGELLGTGTKTKNKAQIDEEVDFIGATLSTSATSVNGSCLSKNTEKLFEIMSDIIVNSEFKQEELDKIKTQAISGLASVKDDPKGISDRVKKVVLYGKDHPYGELETEQSINAITLEACTNYYKTYFVPNISYLAIVGDITLDQAKQLVTKYLGAWEKKDVPKTELKQVKAPLVRKVTISDRSNSVQSVVSVTYPLDLKIGTVDQIKALVVNSILGGSATARLFMNLREKHAYTYGAYSSLSPNEYVGSFTAYCEVRNSVTDSAVAEILAEMNKIRTEKITEEELQNTKNFLTGDFSRSLEDPQTIAAFALNIERYNLPKDYYKNYLTVLNSLTVDDIYEAAGRMIKPNNAYVVVVGKADEISAPLKKFAQNGKIDYLDMNGEKVDLAAKKIPEGLTIDKVLNNYMDAIGGKDAIEKVKTASVMLKGKMPMGDFTVNIIKKENGKLYQKIDAGMFVQETVTDGIKAKQSAMGQSKMLEGNDLEQLKFEAAFEPYLNLSKYGVTAELTGVENIDGKDYYKVTNKFATGKSSVTYFDIETGLKNRDVATLETPQGNFTQTTIYGDYKEVNGVKLPHKYTQIMAGQSFDLNVTDIQINADVPDSKFEVK